MPRYFFDLIHDDDIDADKVGMDLARLIDAKAEALRALAEIARPDVHVQGFRVRGEDGTVVATVKLTIGD